MTKSMARSGFLRIPEVAEYCAVHPATIYREIRRGRLQATYIAGAVRIHSNELDRYVEERTPENGELLGPRAQRVVAEAERQIRGPS